MRTNRLFGGLMVASGTIFVGGTLAAVVVVGIAASVANLTGIVGLGTLGAAQILIGGFVATGRAGRLAYKDFSLDLAEPAPASEPQRRTLPPSVERTRRTHSAHRARARALPGANAPSFRLLNDTAELRIGPAAEPSIPSYLLDSAFRIVDWNDAFSLCFDRTMEGRRGENVLEWTYFLDNYEEVLEHGIRSFGDPDKLPSIDVEIIRYTSLQYGPLSAKKRAYQIPKDDGDCAGWLVVLDIAFSDDARETQYHRDLVNSLARGVMWSEYALSYDAILRDTPVYEELLALVLGESGEMSLIDETARILDLGAGTGNITERLAANERRTVVAIDNNRTMLGLLQAKCRRLLRSDADAPGVIAIKQDVTTLRGLDDEYFDIVIANNIFYALDDPGETLREAYRVLKSGGELRLSGPKKTTRLDKLFLRIERELDARGVLRELRDDFDRVKRINHLGLSPMLYRWDLSDVRDMVLEAGFSEILFETDRAYAGQSIVIAARK